LPRGVTLRPPWGIEEAAVSVEWQETPGTLKAARIITIVGASIGTLAACLVGYALSAAQAGTTDSGAAGLVVVLLLVAVVLGWLNVYLAVGACNGSNARRWVLVAFCWIGLAADVVSLFWTGFSCGTVVNIAVNAILLGLLQFSGATNDYLRAMNQPLPPEPDRPGGPLPPLAWPTREGPLPGTEDEPPAP
jgi:hypothetical protein